MRTSHRRRGVLGVAAAATALTMLSACGQIYPSTEPAQGPDNGVKADVRDVVVGFAQQQQQVAEQKADVDSAFIGFFETVLLVFAAVALLVAAFSIYNAFSMVTAQRTRESALLRALVPGVAGASGMAQRDFTIFNLVGGVTWAAVIAALGFGAGAAYASVLSRVNHASVRGIRKTRLRKPNPTIPE